MNTTNIIATIELESGLCITLNDETRHYFGGYYHVKVVARCIIPLENGHFDDDAQYWDAYNRLGESVRFERVLEKMAVPEQDIAAVRNQLVDAFNDATIRYLASPGFDRRFVRNEYRLCLDKSSGKVRFKDL